METKSENEMEMLENEMEMLEHWRKIEENEMKMLEHWRKIEELMTEELELMTEGLEDVKKRQEDAIKFWDEPFKPNRLAYPVFLHVVVENSNLWVGAKKRQEDAKKRQEDAKELGDGLFKPILGASHFVSFIPVDAINQRGEHNGGSQNTTDQPQQKSKLVSGVYKDGLQNTPGKPRPKMEHCADSSGGNEMNLVVKCREKTPDHNVGTGIKPWVNISDVCPDAVVEEGHNYVTLSVNEPLENYEFAVFGTPQKNDRKRMQIGVFGEKPVQGMDWKIRVVLFDDTMMAFEHVCEKEEQSGRQLLTTLAGLFVSNSDEDIKINLSGLEIGWETKGSNIKTIKSKDAWNSPEDSANFPSCHFEISHTDKTKRAFFCGITATHGNDSAETELVEVYEEQEDEVSTGGNKSMVFPEEVVMITVGDVIFHLLFDFQLRKEIDEIKLTLASSDDRTIKPPLDLALVYINQVVFVLLNWQLDA